MYPTKDEFKEFLKTRNVNWIIDHHIFDGLPFFSAHQPELHDQMVRSIAKGLGVPRGDIRVVGSARIGFSLSPHKYGDPFDQFSDIDIVVVSSTLFDPSWLDILESTRKSHSALRKSTRRQLTRHRELHFIYNGWIYPEKLPEALKIGERWLKTFNGLSHIPELATRTIGGRLYRTWDHARQYHVWSLQKVIEATSPQKN